MKISTRLSVAFASLLLAVAAHAGGLTLSWTLPTLNTDGSTIGAAGDSLTKSTIYYGICVAGAVPTSPTKLDIAVPALTTTINNLAPGQYCMAMTVTNNSSVESDRTNVATKTIAAPKPMPPGSLMIAATEIYQLIGTKGRLVFNPVGTVPAATACDPAQSLSGYLNNVLTNTYVVPLDGVTPTWYGTVKPPLVVAVCS